MDLPNDSPDSVVNNTANGEESDILTQASMGKYKCTVCCHIRVREEQKDKGNKDEERATIMRWAKVSKMMVRFEDPKGRKHNVD